MTTSGETPKAGPAPSAPVSPFAVWERFDRFADAGETAEAAAELDELGFGTAWIGGAPPERLFDIAGTLLGGSERLRVASGILNIRLFPAGPTGVEIARLEEAHPGRFLPGLGVGHGEFAGAQGVEYTAPVPAMNDYLDVLDKTPGVPARRVLAALGPRMLRLARERADGAHPYFITPEHTRRAREVLGDGPLLMPEQKVIFETDPARARAIAREAAAMSLRLGNYARNLKTLGYTDDDLADGGSDRLVDALVVWGDEETIVRRLREHLDAGADQVGIHVLTGQPGQAGLPRAWWRRLAPALFG